MRHRMNDTKLGRSSAHRKALLASLVCGLIEEKRIKTTLPKARLARSMAEKMVTLALKGTLAARRQAIAALRRPERVAELFDQVAPGFKDRNGGYTRIVKLGPRAGDCAEMALLEWVGTAAPEKKKKKAEPAAAEA